MLKHVTLYASENTMGLSMGLTHDVLKFASDLQHKLLGNAITVKLVTIDGNPTTTFSGLAITPDCALADIDETDLVILHSVWGTWNHYWLNKPLYTQSYGSGIAKVFQ